MVDVVKRKPGRPRKAEVVLSEGETLATVVKPVVDPEHDPNPVAEVPVDPFNAVESGSGGDARNGEQMGLASVFGDAGGPDSGGVVEVVALSPAEVEAAKNPVVIPDIGAHIETPEPEPEVVMSPQQVVALDHDFDGEAGGSRPHAKLTELQRDAFAQDVIDAYEGQLEIKRGDAFNRIWTFRHEIVKNMDHMLVEVRRGPTVAQRLISTAVFTKGQAMVAIEGADEETAR